MENRDELENQISVILEQIRNLIKEKNALEVKLNVEKIYDETDEQERKLMLLEDDVRTMYLNAFNSLGVELNEETIEYPNELVVNMRDALLNEVKENASLFKLI